MVAGVQKVHRGLIPKASFKLDVPIPKDANLTEAEKKEWVRKNSSWHACKERTFIRLMAKY